MTTETCIVRIRITRYPGFGWGAALTARNGREIEDLGCYPFAEAAKNAANDVANRRGWDVASVVTR